MFRPAYASVTLSGAKKQNMQHKFRNIKLHRKHPTVNTFLKLSSSLVLGQFGQVDRIIKVVIDFYKYARFIVSKEDH
ncbi:hypothetical protein PUN28_006265 [Cardiocondyla obscurior]|uniref:Uncharacterized protein n=1 Tax=Cardiocondyla obscurior TaxID=286306 RepID=A0AAW2G9S1_9HYME